MMMSAFARCYRRKVDKSSNGQLPHEVDTAETLVCAIKFSYLSVVTK